jgi:hypothetical protein
VDSEVVPSYCLAYSVPTKKSFSSGVDFVENGVVYLKKDGAKIVPIMTLQNLLGSTINMNELLSNGLSLEKQMELRNAISKSFYDISTIFITESATLGASYKIEIEYIMQEDIDEN